MPAARRSAIVAAVSRNGALALVTALAQAWSAWAIGGDADFGETR
jgi:hypothetical protein